jgi:hypothetical protein
MMSAVYLQDMAWISALGQGSAARDALIAQPAAGVAPTDKYTPGRVLHLGCVAGELPSLEDQPVIYRSRTNALLAALLPDLRVAANKAIARFGPLRSRRARWARRARPSPSPPPAPPAPRRWPPPRACCAVAPWTRWSRVVSTP